VDREKTRKVTEKEEALALGKWKGLREDSMSERKAKER